MQFDALAFAAPAFAVVVIIPVRSHHRPITARLLPILGPACNRAQHTDDYEGQNYGRQHCAEHSGPESYVAVCYIFGLENAITNAARLAR